MLYSAKILLLFGMLASFSGVCRADEVRVAVASNFADTLQEIASQYQAEYPHRIIITRGATGKLYAQIVNGAPFDVFFAADIERPRQLETNNIGLANSRFSYARGRLVLWDPAPGLTNDVTAVLQNEAFNFLAIANPRLAPYGSAAEEVLRAMKLWDRIQTKLVRGENINQTFQFVYSGNADLGLVARSQLAVMPEQKTGSVWLVPETMHTPIVQQAILLRDSDAIRSFIDFVRSDTGADTILNHGYDLPADRL